MHHHAEHVVAALAVDHGAACDRVDDGQVAGDCCRPHEPVGEQVRRGQRTDHVELVVDHQAVPITEPKMPYDSFLPLVLVRCGYLGKDPRDRHGFGQPIAPGDVCGDRQHERRVPAAGKRHAARRVLEGRRTTTSRACRGPIVSSDAAGSEPLLPTRYPQAISIGVIVYSSSTGSLSYETGGASGRLAASHDPSTWMVTMQLRQENLTWQVAGDDVVVLDLKGSVYLKLNGSGRVLWETLAVPRTDSELAAALVDKFGIDAKLAAADVAAFVEQLRSRDLLAD